jgi:hypothetical protein
MKKDTTKPYGAFLVCSQLHQKEYWRAFASKEGACEHIKKQAKDGIVNTLHYGVAEIADSQIVRAQGESGVLVDKPVLARTINLSI